MEAASGTIQNADKPSLFEVDYERIFNKDIVYNFIVDNKLIIILWAFTAVMDAWSTTLFMQYTGPESELNILTRGCAHAMGTSAGPYIAGVLKLALALPFLIIFKRGAAFILLLSTGGQIYAIFANVDVYNTFTNATLLMQSL
jgi:hypothetical protein